MNYFNVEGHTNLKRDPRTNSIINTNMSQYQEYLNKRDKKTEENQKLQNLEVDIVSMKEDLNEIKNLLRNLTNGS
jgi:hypothetical protein